MRIGKFITLTTAVSSASVALVSCNGPKPNGQRPNIIVFLVDDMGLMDTSVPFLTGPDGQPVEHPLNRWYRTPNMQRLADQGVRFSQFYAQSVSSPSRTSLMTGQNATRHGVTNWIYSEADNRNTYGPPDWNWLGLDSADYTLARMLSDAGYRTIHVGKAHFGPFGSQGEDPLNLGFDVNVAGCSIGEPGSYYGRDGYGLYRGTRSRAVPGLEEFFQDDVFLTDALTVRAEEEMSRAIEEGVPFYLNMAHYAVHAPFMSDPRFIQNYEPDSLYSTDAKEFATLIEGMDRSLGEIMDFLEEKGVAENTLIFFLGDNGSDAPLGDERGYGSSAPLRGKKGTEFEGGMRVPFIVAWAAPEGRRAAVSQSAASQSSASRSAASKTVTSQSSRSVASPSAACRSVSDNISDSRYSDRRVSRKAHRNSVQHLLPVPQGEVRTQLGTIMDIYPTIAAVAGADIPGSHPVDGHDLSLIITDGEDPHHPDTFLMHFPHDHRGKYFTVYREDDWKLIYYWSPEKPSAAHFVLYDLASDPYETEDVSPRYPDVASSLLEHMAVRLERECARYPVDSAGRPLSVRTSL